MHLLVLTVFGFLLGSVLGSLVKAIADRSLKNKTFWGRSYCPVCKKALRWYDLFPIVSYLLLRGKCRFCKKRIPLDYLLTEIAMGALVGFLFYQSFPAFPPLASIFQLPISISPAIFQLAISVLDLLFKIFFITVLAIITITDLKDTLIPDRVIFPAILISLAFLVIQTAFKIGYLYYYLTLTALGRLLLPPHSDYFARHTFYNLEPLIFALLAALAIGGFFLGLIIITKGKGMGGGDVKLGALMGLGLGFPNSLLAVTLAFLIGAISAVGLIVAGKKHFGENIPFGPFLVLGSLIALFWGNQIIQWYLNLSR